MIYFDEAGNSGGNLLDKDQPSYVLASHNYNEAETRKLLNPLLTLSNAAELHFKDLKKYKKFRNAIIDCINHELIQQGRIYFYYAHKEFLIGLQMVDLLIEPVMHHSGVNMYQTGYNISTANLLYILGTGGWDRAFFDQICIAFVRWIRSDTDENCIDFYESVEKLYEVTKPDYQDILEMILASKRHLGTIRNALCKYTLDITLSCFVAHCTFWAKVYNDQSFDVTFDKSKQIDYWRSMIDFLTHSLPAAEVGFGSRKHKYPLLINSLNTEDSNGNLQLQLADIFASSINYIAIQKINGTTDEFSEQILASRLFKNTNGNSMWPGKEMTPEQLDMTDPSGSDPLEFLARAAQKNEEKYNKAYKGT